MDLPHVFFSLNLFLFFKLCAFICDLIVACHVRQSCSIEYIYTTEFCILISSVRTVINDCMHTAMGGGGGGGGGGDETGERTMNNQEREVVLA